MIGGGTGDALVAELAQRGLHAFDRERGAALFSWAAGRTEPWIAVAPIDWAAYAKARLGRSEPLLREVKGAANWAALAENFAAMGASERRKLLTDAINDALVRTLQLSPDWVDDEREFGAMGLTSLLAMEFRNRLERTLGRALPAALAWNYPTVRALADHLADDTGPPAASATITPIPPIQLRTALGAIVEMSDANARAALRNRGRIGAS
jgi:myxalamid-type polyketide synthase MxaE and MxaD